MRKRWGHYVAVGVLLLGGGRAVAQGSLVSAIEGERPFGSLSVVGPLERAVTSQPGTWAPVPGLSTAVYSRAGDALEITVSGETFGAQNAWLRALVDGASASPIWVRFRTTADTLGETRTFTFVHPGVSAGQHVVEIQWFTSAGTTVQMRDRALTVQSASTTSGAGRLAVTSATTELAGPVSAWTPMASTSTSLTTSQAGPLAITFSGELSADSGRFFVRAVVDGAVVSDVLMAQAGLPRVGRSYTFVTSDLPAGPHSVRIDFYGEGGTLRIGARTLAVSSAPTYLQTGGGLVAGGLQLAPTAITSTTYTELTSWFFFSADPVSSALVSVGAEVRVVGNGRLFFRPVIDGRLAQPGDVELVQGDNRWRAASFTFALKNLTAGAHTFSLQAAVDSGSTGYVADRFYRIHHKPRSGSEFAQPFLHPTLAYTQAPKGQVTFNPLVICFDPLRPAHPAPSLAQLRNFHEGLDGKASPKSWFAENSGGRVTMGSVNYYGCVDGHWFPAPSPPEAPEDRRGNWYWDHQAWDVMFKDALKAADGAIDYHSYDLNHDNQLTPDEVVIEIVHPQMVPDGFGRGTSVELDGVSTPLGVSFSQLYASPDETRRRETAGIAAHEMAHLVLRAEDLHTCPSSTRPAQFSLMDARNMTHLDPWHKLHSGFIAPALLNLSSWTPGTVWLDPVETGREVLLLFDRARGDREYFVIESRVPSLAPNDDPSAGAVVVWHLIDDPALAAAFPPPGGESCGWDRNSVRRRATLRTLGDNIDLTWADGSSARVRATLGLGLGSRAEVQLASIP